MKLRMKMSVPIMIMIGAFIGLTYNGFDMYLNNYLMSIIVYMIILMSAYILLDMRYKVIRK